MIPFHVMERREKFRVFIHVEAAWGVSCVNALECAHGHAPSRNTDITPSTYLDIDHRPIGGETEVAGPVVPIIINLDHSTVGEDTEVASTVVPIIVDMIDIIHLLLVAVTSIAQRHLKLKKRLITML